MRLSWMPITIMRVRYHQLPHSQPLYLDISKMGWTQNGRKLTQNYQTFLDSQFHGWLHGPDFQSVHTCNTPRLKFVYVPNWHLFIFVCWSKITIIQFYTFASVDLGTDNGREIAYKTRPKGYTNIRYYRPRIHQYTNDGLKQPRPPPIHIYTYYTVYSQLINCAAQPLPQK